MAERPEDLNLPNAVITRIIKEAVSTNSGDNEGWVGSLLNTDLYNDILSILVKEHAS